MSISVRDDFYLKLATVVLNMADRFQVYVR